MKRRHAMSRIANIGIGANLQEADNAVKQMCKVVGVEVRNVSKSNLNLRMASVSVIIQA